jgi:rhodanese-related sulfurtransferase
MQFRTQKAHPDHPAVNDIDPQEVWEKHNDPAVVLVDVRRPDEFTGELGHIPGSRHIVLDALPQRLHELPSDKALVFVCRSGARSFQAAAFASEQGFASVFNMAGGMILWNQLGLTVEGKSAQ